MRRPPRWSTAENPSMRARAFGLTQTRGSGWSTAVASGDSQQDTSPLYMPGSLVLFLLWIDSLLSEHLGQMSVECAYQCQGQS